MDTEQELSLHDLVALIRRGLPFALAVAIGAAALTYVLSSRITPEYSSTTTLLASRPNSNLQGGFGVSLVTAPVIDVSAYQAAAKSYPVLRNALVLMGEVDPVPELVSDFEELVTVRVETASQSSLLRISVHDADPLTAADAANAVGSAMLAWDEARATQNLQVVIDTLAAQIASLDAEILMSATGNDSAQQSELTEGLRSLRADRALQLNSARALRTSAVGLLEVLEPALPSATPATPRPVRNSALAFVLGLFLVYGLVLLREALDTRFRSGDDLLRATDLPVLGEFPRLATGTLHLPQEATGYLRTNVTFATATDLPKVLLITSARPDEGKSSVALGLAESFARNDYRTLIIDADMRKPQLFRRLGVDPERADPSVTLRARLQNGGNQTPPLTVSVRGASFDLVPTFAPEAAPSEILSNSFAGMLQRFKPEYDVIIVDSPPLLPVADSLTMAPHTTGVVLAVSLPTTDRRSVTAALDLLGRMGVRLLGTVMTNVDQRQAGRSGYGYGYGYGGVKEERREVGSTPPKPDHPSEAAAPVSSRRT